MEKIYIFRLTAEEHAFYGEKVHTMTGFFEHPCPHLLIPFSQGLRRDFHSLVDNHAGRT